MKQNAVNFKWQNSCSRGQFISSLIYLEIMYLILKENQTQTKITEIFITSVDYNRCRLVFMQFSTP